MIIEKYVARRCPNTVSFEEIFNKKKLKRIKKTLSQYKENNIQCSIIPLTDEDLQTFYQNIYKDFITKKSQPNIINIIEKTEEGRKKGRKYYICKIEQNKNII